MNQAFRSNVRTTMALAGLIAISSSFGMPGEPGKPYSKRSRGAGSGTPAWEVNRRNRIANDSRPGRSGHKGAQKLKKGK